MFTDWLDAGPLDYSSLAVAFTPWARGAGSDAQAYPCRYAYCRYIDVCLYIYIYIYMYMYIYIYIYVRVL